MFAVPKPDGTSRPILNLSDCTIHSHSVNDTLDPNWCTVEYIQHKEIIELLIAMGPGAWLWAKDLADGYYNIPIRKEDIAKLGFWFDGKIFLYQVLPMGLGTAPRIFTEFMSFPIWAMKQDKPALYYLYVSADKIDRRHFSDSADLTFIPQRNQYKIALIDYYIDDWSKTIFEFTFIF